MFVVTPPPPSRRALELGEKITELLFIYKEEYPEMRLIDVQQAMRIAEQNLRARMGGLSLNRVLLIGVAVLLALALAGVALMASRSGAGGSHVLVMIMVGLAVVVAAAAVLARR